MGTPQILVNEYRANTLECFHYGSIAICDEHGLVHSVGDADFMCFYRSSSKPIQALPFLVLGLDKKYGLTDEEISIMSGSLWCGPRQVELVKSIMQKADISYDTLIMQPCYPLGHSYELDLIAAGEKPSKLYHNCIGKHLSLIMVQRELGDERDYYKEDSAVQRMILRDIAEFSDFPQERIELGIDGCGVPVFAVPLHNMATSFVKLVAPELLQTPALAHAAKRNVDIVSRHPENLMDANATCGVLCRDPNIIGKVGAQGVYTFGLKKERLGFACKVYDGQSAYFPLIIAHTLELLSYDNKETIERLRAAFPDEVTNATGAVVGIKKAAFSF